MGQIIKTISVSKAEDEFITLNKISPTRLLRNKIQEMMEFQTHGYTLKEINELERKVGVWKSNFEKLQDFIESRGLTNEFLEEKNEQ